LDRSGEAALEAVRTDDQDSFAEVVERYRRPLQVHCYRMLGSFEDAEDLVQETMLRAWRARAGFEGRSSFRTWLYRIATNACLNALGRGTRRVVAPEGVPAANESGPAATSPPERAWLQPYPDDLLEPAAPAETEPDAMLVSKETIELVYLTALQHLRPRQRAVLVVRDALGWSARDAADLLDITVTAANSILQRARSTMRAHLPPRRLDWKPQPGSDDDRAVLRRFMEAFEQADVAALGAILREDARLTMPPAPLWFRGRPAMLAHYAFLLAPDFPGDFRVLPTAANRQPAMAAYLRTRGDSEFRLSGLNVLRVEGGRIAEITAFGADLCHGFDLPRTLP
jgi:RNA polymerase sigma-70 factor (ECF subfamily)